MSGVQPRPVMASTLPPLAHDGGARKKAGGDKAPARACFLPLASLPVASLPVGVLPPASVPSSQTGPGARPGPMRSERDAPAVERAGITLAVVLHAQVPLAIETLAGQIDGVGLVDVVGAAAGAVVQLVHAAVRRDQVDLEVADVGVGDVDRDVGLGQAAAAAAGNVDRAAEHLAVVDGEVVTVGVGLNFVVAGITGVAVVTLVLADQGDAAVRLVSLDAD